MYAKNIRPSAKRDNRIARPRRAQTCERSDKNVSAKRSDFYYYWIGTNIKLEEKT